MSNEKSITQLANPQEWREEVNSPGAAVVVPETPLAAEERPHHEYGMSKLQPLDACAAYQSQGGTSEAAEEGTFFHGLMDKTVELVKAGKYETSQAALKEVLKGLDSPLLEVEENYLVYCCMKVDRLLAKRPKQILHEIKVTIRNPDGSELNHGYLDLILVWDTYAILIDYKFGWVPVTAAKDNLQGMGYCLGYFMESNPQISRIGACFIQPKINYITEHVWTRREVHMMYDRIRKIIVRAKAVRDFPLTAQQYMKPGKHCEYCSRKGLCTVLANHAGIVAHKYGGLPLPKTFIGMELSKPEDVALARYWVDCVEPFAKEIKARAFEIAEANGGTLSCTLRDGSTVRYSMEERSSDRKLGEAGEIAQSLQAVGLTPEQVMGAAELKLGKLESVVTDAMVQIAKAEGRKLTKKHAWETVCQLLESEGLLTRDGSKVRYLKLEKLILPTGIEGSSNNVKQLE